jgi:stage V sporulation protein D (sporulation-specific penicillin-binding protein)
VSSPGYTNINLTIKKRLILVFACIFTIFLVLIGRVGWIQLVLGTEYKEIAVEQWTNDVKIDAKRGKILDRNGFELAVSASCERVDLYMRDVYNAEKSNVDIREEMADKLSQILGETRESMLKKLNMTLPSGKPINSVTIKRRIEKSQADEIRKLNLPGIVVSEDSKRYYPNGNFLSHVLGFTNIDGAGQEGIELKYDEQLKGVPGRRIMEADLFRRELPYNISKYVDPVNGSDITLTIDESIQLYVEKALDDALATNKAKSAMAVVMDPKTGEILAMASKPDFNPNDPRSLKGYKDFNEVISSWNNKLVTYTYEPGSVFKAFTSAAAISEGVVNDNTRFSCPGFKVVAGSRIKCWRTRGHGSQTFPQILQNSCNVGFMTVGDMLGKERLYKYIDAFGFGTRTNIDVSFEEKGQVMPIKRVGPVELATISFGQGISVTPIQLVAAYGAIANGGKMMEPHLVKKIQTSDKEGNIVKTYDILPKMTKLVIDSEAARELTGYLEKVVSDGAGSKAGVKGYRVGGKTGTAQKAQNGVYVDGKYVATFLGIAPIDDPKFVVYVAIDEPDPSNYYAGQIAAPVAARIFKDIFTGFNIPPAGGYSPDIEVILPNVKGLKKNEALRELKKSGFVCETKGSGSVVEDMLPKPGLSIQSGSKVILYMGDGQNYNNKVIMPDLLCKDLKEVTAILNSLGLKLNAEGDGYTISQDPEVGVEISKGTIVDVEFDIYGD